MSWFLKHINKTETKKGEWEGSSDQNTPLTDEELTRQLKKAYAEGIILLAESAEDTIQKVITVALDEMQKHWLTLSTKYHSMSVTKDDGYGNITHDTERFMDELTYFYKNMVCPRLKDMGLFEWEEVMYGDQLYSKTIQGHDTGFLIDPRCDARTGLNIHANTHSDTAGLIGGLLANNLKYYMEPLGRVDWMEEWFDGEFKSSLSAELRDKLVLSNDFDNYRGDVLPDIKLSPSDNRLYLDENISFDPVSLPRVLFVLLYNSKLSTDSTVSSPTYLAGNPYEYERYVADQLTDMGFNATVTQASGDYGVDVLAEKDSKKYVVQCKLYSSPVGIKSVQEVYGGMAFYKADVGVVVTNSTFTPAAYNLAHQSRILLLNDKELPKLLEPYY